MQTLEDINITVDRKISSQNAIDLEEWVETELLKALGRNISEIKDSSTYATGEWLYRSEFTLKERNALAIKLSCKEGELRMGMCRIFTNLSIAHRMEGAKCIKHGLMEAGFIKCQHAERCCEKALDMLGVSLDNLFFLPSNVVNNDTFLCLFFNFGAVKFCLDKFDECRKFLELCLHIDTTSDFGRYLHQEARDYYRMLPN